MAKENTIITFIDDNVKVASNEINVDTNYLVLKPNEEFLSNANETEKEGELIKLMEEFDLVEIQSIDYNILTKNILKKLQEKKVKLIIYGKNYTITIEGKDIVNYQNELATNINFLRENEQITFTLNDEKDLPGKLTLHICKNLSGKYLYLYNSLKGKYQLIDNNRIEKSINQAGKYCVANDKISKFGFDMIIKVIVKALGL